MGRFAQDSDSHGSLRNIQILINSKKTILDSEVQNFFQNKIDISWVSPLANDDYAEYRDQEFINRLKIAERITFPLKEFWPKNGPQWDALGTFEKGVFLVEAKAHIGEIVSPPSGAGETSLSIIKDSFSEVKEYLNIRDQIDWTGKFYQYANRLAHLYYLRVRNSIPAHLLFVYFINDETVEGPKTRDKWEGAIEVMEDYLGVSKNHKLKKYIHEVFIDFSAIK